MTHYSKTGINSSRQSGHKLITQLVPPFILVKHLLLTGDEGERGNTPIPSKARFGLVSGMNAIDKRDFNKAQKQLSIIIEDTKNKKTDVDILAAALTGLGYVYSYLEEYDKAISCYKEAFLCWQNLYGVDSPKLGLFLINLATVVQERDLEEAHSLFLRAQTIIQNEEGSEGLNTQAVRCGLARLKIKQGHCDEAEELYQSAWTILNAKSKPQEIPVLECLLELYHLLECESKISLTQERLDHALEQYHKKGSSVI